MCLYIVNHYGINDHMFGRGRGNKMGFVYYISTRKTMFTLITSKEFTRKMLVSVMWNCLSHRTKHVFSII